jgi:hypothetical protein
VHANLEALDAVLAAAGPYDHALVLGDLVGYGADPNAVIDRVRALPDATFIRGNHDKVGAGLENTDGFNYLARHAIMWTTSTLTPERRQWLAALPQGPTVIDDLVEICHGAPFDEDVYIFDDLDAMRALRVARRPLCLFGHTHVVAGYRASREMQSVAGIDDTAIHMPSNDGSRFLINCGAGRTAPRRRSTRRVRHPRFIGQDVVARARGVRRLGGAGKDRRRRAAGRPRPAPRGGPMRTPFGGHWAVRRGPLKSLPTALGRLPTMVVVACVVAACGNSGGIAGTVNEIEGGPLPGVRVTIDGLKTHREATTDTDGRFVFQNLAAGGYTLKTDLADYVGELKAVTVSRRQHAEHRIRTAPGVSGGRARTSTADCDGACRRRKAILYIRFVALSDPDRWIVNEQCIIGIDHTATVLSILNMGADSGSITKTVHIVRDGRVAWNTGEEYIAFVRWEPAIGRYRPIAGPLFMIPVRDGKVVWDRTDAPNIRNGDPVSKAMAVLFALLPSARAAR